jgi:hypothetical protein
MASKQTSPGKYLQKFPPKLATVDDSVRKGAAEGVTAPALVRSGPFLVSPARSAVVSTPLGRSAPLPTAAALPAAGPFIPQQNHVVLTAVGPAMPSPMAAVRMTPVHIRTPVHMASPLSQQLHRIQRSERVLRVDGSLRSLGQVQREVDNILKKVSSWGTLPA